jgi:hypothetical protein
MIGLKATRAAAKGARPAAFTDELAAGQIRFVASFTPGLRDGAYDITLEQTIAAPKATVPSLVRHIVVAGPRFALAPTEIHAQYPPATASGQFADVLPHVVLSRRLLPWERASPPLGADIPWLALLAFDEGELLPSAGSDPTKLVIANYAETTTVRALLSQGAADLRVPHVTVDSEDEAASACQAVTISRETFAAIVPTGRELRYLAHGREVDTAGKILLDMPDDGLFSVVVSNRFPRPGSAMIGAKCIVHLVSLEGFGDLLSGTAPVTPTEARVKLVSLFSWNFSCLPDPQQTFSGLARNLALDATGARRPADSLALRLPFDPIAENDPAMLEVARRLSDGYVALGYHARTGEDGFAWYRGPFTPTVAPAIQKSAPFSTVSAAIIYDPATGLFDHSLAAAWQCGRTLALANQAFASALKRVRQSARTQLHQMTIAAADMTGGGGRGCPDASCRGHR